MAKTKVEEFVENITQKFKEANFSDTETKEALKALVTLVWTKTMLPWFSHLKHAVVEEVQKANVGSALALCFQDKGEWKVVMVEAGSHYDYMDGRGKYMATGGFVNLTKKEGSTFVKEKSGVPEWPQEGAARECEEELIDDKGNPIIPMDPNRLMIMSGKAIGTTPNPSSVYGFMAVLTDDEVKNAKAHIKRTNTDSAYKKAWIAKTINSDSGKPEIQNVTIHRLEDIVNGEVKLLHDDQKDLFRAIWNFVHRYELKKSAPAPL